MECDVTNCTSKKKSKRFCASHYSRNYRYGDPLKGGATRTQRNGVCVVDECNRDQYTELCNMHYQRFRKTGSTDLIFYGKGGMRGRTCSVDGCDGEHKANGLCKLHDGRMRRRGFLEDVDRSNKRGICSVLNCGLQHYGHGYCNMHYQRAKNGVSFDAPRRKPSTPDRVKAQRRSAESKRRAVKRKVSIVPFTTEQLEARMSMFPVCYLCGLAPGATVDHVKPLNKGGLHVLSNIRGACLSCNSKKSDEWNGTDSL